MRAPWGELMIDWERFIDYIFLLWRGDLESLMKFIEHLNNAIPSINFTYEISQTEVCFLDETVHKDEDGSISSDVYQKPTDTHPYLNYNSAHPPHLKKSIPYSQALRLRRICSDDQTLKERIKQYSEYFITRGYKRQTVLQEIHRVLRFTQEECLKPKTQTRLTDRVPLVTTYNPCTTYIAEIANRHLDFLKSKGRLAKIFNQRPLVAYRKPRSLRDMLVSSRFQKNLENNPVNGCKPCKKPRCSWCKYIKTTGKFKGTHCEREYKIFHSVDCQSSWVIYMIQSATYSMLAKVKPVLIYA